MSGPNAAHTLPPGDRDDSLVPPPSPTLRAEDVAPSELIAGRKPFETDVRERSAAIGAVCDNVQFARRDLEHALASGNLALAESAVWRINGAFIADMRIVSHQLARLVGRHRREQLLAEVRPQQQEPA